MGSRPPRRNSPADPGSAGGSICLHQFYSFHRRRLGITDDIRHASADILAARQTRACPGRLGAGRAALSRILAHWQPIFPSATAFTRNHLVRVGGFDERLNRNPSEDLEFTLRSIREAPIGVLTKSAVGIRRQAGSFSGGGLRAMLGSIGVLRLALENHSIPEDWRDLLRQQIIGRSSGAVDAAFGRQDFAALRSQDLIPAELSARRRIKTTIARLPRPAANSIARVLLSIGGMRKAPGQQ